MKPMLILLLTLLLSASARAELYGFVDPQGQTHLADYPVDERYKLFQHATQTAAETSERPAVVAEPAPPDSLISISPVPESPLLLPTPTAPVVINPKLVARFSRLISRTARQFGLDVHLLHSIVTVESAYNPQAVSPSGAIGLMQLMPATGKRFGITALADPRQNLLAGARYLRFLLDLFNNNLPLVIAAYNAGEGTVLKYRNTIPPFRHTRNYVAKVLASYRQRKGEEEEARRQAELPSMQVSGYDPS